MNEEIKKVNSESTISDEEQSVYDEMTRSTREMAAEYQDNSLTREEKLRLEAEKQKADEMKAIREDIERRYSQQVEETERTIKVIGGSEPEEGPTEVLLQENMAMLEDILNLEAFVGYDGKKKKIKKEKKEKKVKEVTFIDLETKNPVYAYIYSIGDIVLRILSFIFGDLLKLITAPLAKLRQRIKSAGGGHKGNIKEYLSYLHYERKQVRREFFTGLGAIISAFRHPKSVPSVINHYIGLSISKHRHFLKTVFNILLPVASVIIMVLVFNSFNQTTLALKVYYGTNEIGYIADESVYIQAKEIYSERLNKNGISSDLSVATSENLDVRYEIAIVSPDKLDDARTISDSMISCSASNLTHACGVYIDGEFICAVKNESDARTVFYNIIQPYEEEAALEGCSVGILETVEYVQSLYSDEKSIMWDAAKLASHIEENSLVKVKKTYTTTVTVDIPYNSISTKDPTKYSGYRVVKQAGVKGKKNVITTTVFVDGEAYSTYSIDEILSEPVDELVTVGGKTTYGGVYIGEASSKGFLWPAPHCRYVSSPYGWRSSGWHKGIDLCTTNATAKGSPVIASRSGVVEVVQHSSSGYGNMILINHGDGYKTRYAHLLDGSINVKVGDYVEGGQTIAKVGSTGNSTGPHLHFEVIINGETYDPKNYIS